MRSIRILLLLSLLPGWVGSAAASEADTLSGGKIIYPWNAATAIVRAGERFEAWFDADPGQRVTSVALRGPYNMVLPSFTITAGDWEYDPVSGGRYDTRIAVTVPADTPADRYDLVLNTARGRAVSVRAVKVVRDYKTRYKILHISDIHLGQGRIPKGLTEAKLTAIVDMANILNPELVFVTGDNIIWAASRFQDRVDLFFEGDDSKGFKGLHDLDAASFVVAGNHDYAETTEDRSCCFESKSTFWNRYYGLQTLGLKYGNTRCLLLNDGWDRYDFSGQLTGLATWLDGEGKGGNLRLLACHIPRETQLEPFVNENAIGLVLVGHMHHMGDNPYRLGNGLVKYYARSVREYCEFNLLQVDDRTGNYTVFGDINAASDTEGFGRPTGRCRVLRNDDRKNNPDTSVWEYNLTLDYDHPNDGNLPVNTAALVNQFDFPISDAHVRFVMPRGGAYAVSAGTIEQQFDGERFRIVDVSIDLNANGTTTVDIAPAE